MSNIPQFAALQRSYLKFLACPISQVHILLTTDPDRLFAEADLFKSLLDRPTAHPAVILQSDRFAALWMADRYNHHLSSIDDCCTIYLPDFGRTGRQYHPTRTSSSVVMTTYDQMLKQRSLLDRATVLVLCNTQEKTMAQTLVKAIIRHRMIHRQEPVFLLILTNNPIQVEDDQKYYGQFVKRLLADAEPVSLQPVVNAYKDNALWQQDKDRGVIAKALTELQCRSVQQGMVICVVDYLTARRVESAIIELIVQEDLASIEVVVLHDGCNHNTQRQALTHPEPGTIRVLITLGVLESAGIHLPWVDVLISDGLCQQRNTSVISGGNEWVITQATQHQLWQQRLIPGDTQRATLCSTTAPAERAFNSIAEIFYLPISEIVLQTIAAGFTSLQLDYDAGALHHITLKQAAEQLCELGLLQQFNTAERQWILTEGARLTQGLDIGVHSRVMFMIAAELGIINIILPIIAVIEAGGMRHRAAVAHGIDADSDILDSVKAFIMAITSFQLDKSERARLFESNNISFHRMQVAQRGLLRLQQFCGLDPYVVPYLDLAVYNNPESLKQIKACLFAAFGPRVFITTRSQGDRITWKDNNDKTHSLGSASVLANRRFTAPRTVITGLIRRLTNTRSPDRSFAIIEHATLYTDDELLFISQTLPRLIQQSLGAQELSLFQGHTWLTTITLNTTPAGVDLETMPSLNHESSLTEVHITKLSKRTAQSTTQPSSELDSIALTMLNESSSNTPVAVSADGRLKMISKLASTWGAKETKRRR